MAFRPSLTSCSFARESAFGGLALFVLVLLCHPLTASAGEILFVSDAGADTNIATALAADGHTITSMSRDYSTGNLALKADLSAFDVVYWSASGGGSGSTHSDSDVFTNLTSYVAAGGMVFVTGYDSVASPSDSLLIAFVGATSSSDGGARLGPIVAGANSLNSGVVDLAGVTPTGGSINQDSLIGLMPGTIDVAPGGGNAGWTLRAVGAGEIAFVSNGDAASSSHPSWTTTTPGGTGAYNAAIRNFASASDSGSTEPGAPEIVFTGERAVEEGAAVDVMVEIVDPEGDEFSFSWDVDGDGEFGENADIDTIVIEAGTTDGPDSVRLAVTAMDASGNTSIAIRSLRIANVAPTITSSPARTIASVGAPFIYDILVEDPGGVFDPLLYTLMRGPERMGINPDGRLSWTPNETEVTSGDENYEVELAVTDGDGGSVSQSFALTVSPNRAPTLPVPLYPVAGTVLLDRMPRLVADNATDPDVEDTLTYFFQLDNVETFDSPSLQESGPVEETPGFSFWQIDAPLRLQTYYWRVWVSDGTFDSEPVADTFTVATDVVWMPDGGGIADAGGSDGGIVVPPPTMRDEEGCSVSSDSPLGAGMLGLVVLSLLSRRRRRA